MDYLPSPPSSPSLSSVSEKVVCGSCDRELGMGWFCSQCHTKCSTCSRFLTDQDYCTRCWLDDTRTIRKNDKSAPFILTTTPYFSSFQYFVPSPTNSSGGLTSRENDSILPLNLFTPPFVS